MAIAPVVLLTEADAVDRINYTTTVAVTPTPNRVVAVGLAIADLANATATAPVLTGCGLTWTGPIFTGTAAYRLLVWHAFADPALVVPGTLTATGVVTAATADGAIWHVVEIDGVNPTTTNGVRQALGGTTTADTITVTLGAFANVANGVLAFVMSYDDAGGTQLVFTPGAGFTMLTQTQVAPGGSEAFRIGAEWRADNDTTVDCTVVAANDRFNMVALELDGTAWTPPAPPFMPSAVTTFA